MKTITCETLNKAEVAKELEKLEFVLEDITKLNRESSKVLKDIRTNAGNHYTLASFSIGKHQSDLTNEKFEYLKARASLIQAYADAVLKSRGDFS